MTLLTSEMSSTLGVFLVPSRHFLPPLSLKNGTLSRPPTAHQSAPLLVRTKMLAGVCLSFYQVAASDSLMESQQASEKQLVGHIIYAMASRACVP